MLKTKKKLILAIESSCDETAAAVLEYTPNKVRPAIHTLSSVVKSQIAIHTKTGGVIPEAAAREHIKNIRPVVEAALKATPYPLNAIHYIAVTQGPGLIPSLMVGVEFAKTLSMATGIPLLPVNHMAGHLYSPFGGVKDKRYGIKDAFPNISLIVSGGHTMLVLMKDPKTYRVLGQTVDDAAGEAFDKVARLLNLPYPGGPEVSKCAAQGNSSAIAFPRPMLRENNFNFSFSGLKTAVLYKVKDLGLTRPANGGEIKDQLVVNDLCASFEQAVVDVLVGKTVRAAQKYNAKSISLSGGVAANLALRNQLSDMCNKLAVKFFVPPQNLCTDNAEMIGIAAAYMLHKGIKPKPYYKIQADPGLKL